MLSSKQVFVTLLEPYPTSKQVYVALFKPYPISTIYCNLSKTSFDRSLYLYSKGEHAMTRSANFYLYQLNSVEWI